MATGYGFFPASGTNYSAGQESQIASRLQRLGKALKLHLIGVSGYRSPAHSVAVGGFANDPHTHGQASDTPGVESVSESVLNRFGLTRPFPGAAEADHVQLLRGSRSTARAPASYTLADLWTQAGGPRNMAPIMAAIAMAESGGRTDAVSPQNTDGTYDYGPWQINSSHTQFDKSRLISDPLYNARAAVSIYRSQGLGAWTTYMSGAYRQFLGTGSNTKVATGGIVRPGGDTGNGSSEVDSIFASYVQGVDSGGTTEDVSLKFDPLNPLDPFNPGDPLGIPLPDPTKIFTDPAKAIKDTSSFLKWIAWIFHPVNILRAVEFVSGITLLIIGIQSMVEVWRGDPQQSILARGGRATRTATRDAVQATPVGKAQRVRTAARQGRREAQFASRAKETSAARRKGRVAESKRQNKKRERSLVRDIKGEDIPF